MPKDIQMRERVNGDSWDDMNPLTKSRNVTNEYGITEDKLNGMTPSRMDLYVSSTNGVDSPLSGSETNPFKTIQYAVDSIPKYVNNDWYIWIEDGEYDEEIRIKGFTGSALVLGRKDGIIDPYDASTGLEVTAVEVMDCTGLVRINNFTQLRANCIKKEAYIRASRCAYVTVHAIRADDPTIIMDTVQFDGSTGSVNRSFFNGQVYCIVAKNGSSVRIDSTCRHGTTQSGTGVLAQAATVSLNGTNDWTSGTSNEYATSQGGTINSQLDVLDLTPLLKNGWTAYDQNRNMPRALRHNGVVYLQGLINLGSVGQGIVAFTLPRLWTPQFNSRLYSPLCADGSNSRVLITVGGDVAVEQASGQYISLSDIPPFYVGF
ncbi:glycoside hydrolase [Bacillus phage Sarmo]|nr:glycoside hydrolase [Bacillus phage Sarmo]